MLWLARLFMPKSERINSEFQAFERLHVKLKGSYKPYTDKAKITETEEFAGVCSDSAKGLATDRPYP